MNSDAFPDSKFAPNGSAPTAFIMHHTAGRGDPASVVANWQNDGRGYGAQYIMDRNGVIHDTQKEFGYNGYYEILPGEGQYSNLDNHNTVGMEIVANNDADVTSAQAQAAAAFIQARYPNTPVFGHGQVNPGHKEATEGATAVNAVNALRGGEGSSTVATGPDNRQIFFDALRGAGLSPQQALGALWSIGGESHPNIDTTSYNPNDPGGSVGALQWLGPRRWPLEEIAKSRGVAVTDPHLQAEYMVGELTGNLQGAQFQPGVLDALKQAKTPEEAARIWTAQMERPKVDNSDQRIANGAAVGSLDANGNFVPGTAKAAPAVASAGAGTGAAAQPMYAPPSPQAIMGSTIGQALAGIGGGMSTPSGGGGYMDNPDQPAIRSMASMTDFMPSAPNPVPAQFSGGGIGSQLGSLAAQPAMTPLENPANAPSITQGAPSMTGMLGDLGTTATPGLFDNRGGNQLTPNPYRRVMRLA
jgi:hypothetical protein